MDKIKSQFPIFEKLPGLVYLDSGATTLKPLSVIEAEDEYYKNYSANIHRGVYEISEIASEKYEEARKIAAEFIGAKSEREIVFTRGATESINLVARGLKVEGEILVSQMELHANLLPWQRLAKDSGSKLVELPLKDGEIDSVKLRDLVNEKIKVLAITHASNVLGTVNPIKKIVEIVRSINPKVIVVVDGAQMIAHGEVNVADLDVDFYAFSGHKAYGPTGIGVLWGREDQLEKLEPMMLGGGMIKEVTFEGATYADLPERLEAGTPPIAQAIGLGAALTWIRKIGFEEISKKESEVLEYAVEKLGKIEGVKTVGVGKERLGIISFVVEGIHAHDVATILDRQQVCVRSGHHCAMPLHKLIGVEATVRMSLGIYNEKEDIDKLVEGIVEAKRIFGTNPPAPADAGTPSLDKEGSTI